MRINIGGFALDDPEKMRKYLTKPLAVEPSLTNVRHDIYGKDAADQEKVHDAEKEFSKRVKRRALMNRQTVEEVTGSDKDESQEQGLGVIEQVREAQSNTDWAAVGDVDSRIEIQDSTTIDADTSLSESAAVSESMGEIEENAIAEALPSNNHKNTVEEELRTTKNDNQTTDMDSMLDKQIQNVEISMNSVSQAKRTVVPDVSIPEAIQDYSKMDIKVLYEAVRMYMKRRGVEDAAVSIDELNSKFGVDAIKRLRRASYLIVLGKGVTITDV